MERGGDQQLQVCSEEHNLEFQRVSVCGAVDTSIFLKQGDECLPQMGSTLAPGAFVKISYAWDPPFVMFPKSANTVCLLRAIEVEAYSSI
ncbi:hypothetical protein D8674_014908 [Pyrus ussuriensis x Pyrus communis]|uniref:Uncharacterized protein n=1 Tax=Pyrus ussuriensis x Pyrus communis TaxID=2448454 RepID=A0A5N5GTV6_9ROSA|nr:hypothetical protein D8674_014908 [Pyrus ussuriensis x Pyrus communis]